MIHVGSACLKTVQRRPTCAAVSGATADCRIENLRAAHLPWGVRLIVCFIRALCVIALVNLALLARADIAAPPAPIYRVGVLVDNYPYSFRQPDGAMSGFAYELVRELELVMGLHFERVVGRTREVHDKFNAGQIDLMQVYARFPERETEVEFSVPYLTMAGALFVRADDHRIESLDDCRGKKIAVHHGSMGEAILRRAGLEQSIYYVDSFAGSINAVAAGEADATLVARLSGLAMAHYAGHKNLRPVDAIIPGFVVEYCLAVRRGDHELLAKVNEGLAILVRTGRYNEIYRKWFGHLQPEGYSAFHVMLAVMAGLVVALLVSLWAVMRLRRLQARIVRQADELRTVFDGVHDGLLVLERSAAGELRLRRINPAGLRFLALGTAPAAGASLASLFGRETALVDRLVMPVSQVVNFDYERAESAGWWRVTICPIGEAVLLSLGDITDQVRARQQLEQQQQRMLQAQKLEAIGTLAGGIAHDFNNVLTAILGHTELSLLSLPPSRPEAESLQQVMRAGRRARQLVQQILAFSRRAEPSRQAVDLAAVVKETGELLHVLGRGAVKLETKFAADVPPVFADPVQVHQVLLNIGTNAVQALRGVGGCVTFSLTTVDTATGLSSVATLAPGRYVRVGVQDNGPGMPPEVQARIFEPYFTTKAPGEGTGLGLSVAHGIVQQHGGAITVYSQPGRGTLFHIYLPTATSDLPAKKAARAELPRGEGQQVLVVDDDPVVLTTARHALQRLGYQPCPFERADAALAEFEARPAAFAAVFTDLTMPGMNGLQLTAQIRARDARLPVLLASGFFTEAEEQEAVKLRVTRLVAKPYSLENLADVMADCVPPRG